MTGAVVVGASLAGSAAARALALSGVPVTLLERATFPRPRVCGELLSARARDELSRAGLLDRVLEAGAETIDRFAVVRADGRRVEGALPRPVLSLSRGRLDAIVAQAARHAGARLLEGVTVTSLSGNLEEGFLVKAPSFELRARAAIGAWGRYSPLDGRLGRSFYWGDAALFGFQKHLRGHALHLRGRVVLHLFRGGYLGLSRVEGELVNLAALATTEVARAAHDDLGLLLARLKIESPTLASDLEGLQPEPGPPLLSEPVPLVKKSAVEGDLLLAGDAAGLVDPWTGRGMGKALASGRLAGEVLAAHLAGGLDAAALRARHVADERELARGDFLRARLLRPVFTGPASLLVHPSASFLARALVRWSAA